MTKLDFPTPEQLRQLLDYDPKSGNLYWKERPVELFKSERSQKAWNSRNAGKVALCSTHNSGYKCGGIFGKIYLTHRIAWAVFYGEWPENEIDHKNTNRTDNRISNLRHSTHAENMRNSGKRSNNTSGFKGVNLHKGKWRARVTFNKKQICLGYFDTPEAAYAAYCAAAKIHHGEFSRVV